MSLFVPCATIESNLDLEGLKLHSLCDNGNLQLQLVLKPPWEAYWECIFGSKHRIKCPASVSRSLKLKMEWQTTGKTAKCYRQGVDKKCRRVCNKKKSFIFCFVIISQGQSFCWCSWVPDQDEKWKMRMGMSGNTNFVRGKHFVRSEGTDVLS